MSLDYDLSKIKNREEITIEIGEDGEKYLSATTQNIIFGCLSTHIGTITEANAEEWFARYHLWNKAHDHDNYFTLEDVKNHIGLSTNVLSKMTMLQWFKQCIWRDTLYDIKHENYKVRGESVRERKTQG